MNAQVNLYKCSYICEQECEQMLKMKLKFGLFDRPVEFKFFTKKEQSILRSQQRLHECRRTNPNSQDDDLSLVLGCCGVLVVATLGLSFMLFFTKK